MTHAPSSKHLPALIVGGLIALAALGFMAPPQLHPTVLSIISDMCSKQNVTTPNECLHQAMQSARR